MNRVFATCLIGLLAGPVFAQSIPEFAQTVNDDVAALQDANEIASQKPEGSDSADYRPMVGLPEMMQQHMLANMRDHLSAINDILQKMAADELDQAADIAETRLGMTSLKTHSASHMAPFMPEGMREAGTNMHHAASRFALKAQEGDAPAAYAALAAVTETCVACHSAFRIR